MNNRFRLIKSCLLFIFVFAIGMFISTNEVRAEDYSISCSLFEVSKITDDGGFSKVGCYNDFASATAKMKENEDYVVRNNKSLSPTKIVNMNSGIVYTYPYRANSLTQSVYQSLDSKKNGSGARTYLTIHYPMLYLGSENYNEIFGYSGGWIHVDCHGFDGYADLEYVDFVPNKFLRNGLPIKLGGNDKTSRNEQPFKVVCKPNTYQAVRNGNYLDLVFTSYRGWSSDTNGGVGMSSTTSIGVAPNFMVEGTTYYSSDGVNFYSDISCKNYVGTYYNYYQFVPFRTKTNISGSTLNSYLKDHCNDYNSSQLNDRGDEFKYNESKYGCNATLVFAMGIHESGWGKSQLSYEPYNNLFGYGAYDSNVSLAHQYATISDCIASQMGDNLANYLDVSCGSYFSMSLGTKGGGFMTKYASDPYWAEKIAHYYYEIDKYANGYNGNLSDYNSYNIALVNSFNIEVKRDANPNSQTLYRVANKNGYQKNLITVTLGDANGYTKVQLSNPIDANNNVVYPITLSKGTIVDYDYNRSVGYIPSSALVALNFATTQEPEVVPKEPEVKEADPSKSETLISINSLELEGNVIKIDGIGLISYVNFDDLSKIKHELVIKNLETGNEAAFDLSTYECEGFGLNDGYNYKYIGFNGEIDLSPVIEGAFVLQIRITNDQFISIKDIRSSESIYKGIVSKVGNLTNKISSNPRYYYRLELEIFKTPIDYTKLNIKYNRPSLFSFDNLTIDDEMNLHIDGVAFIYYTNYDVSENVSYKAYLVKDDVNFIEFETNNITCPINYSDALKSSFDLTNVCFEANVNIKDLEAGEYDMVMEIDKVDGEETLVDFIKMTNLGDFNLPTIENETGKYSIINTNTNGRMKVKVKK